MLRPACNSQSRPPVAQAPYDVGHDRADKEASKRIECPMLHLWAVGGPLDTFYAADGGPLGIWRQWAPHAQGQAVKGGHFFPEENPDDTAFLVKQFPLHLIPDFGKWLIRGPSLAGASRCAKSRQEKRPAQCGP